MSDADVLIDRLVKAHLEVFADNLIGIYLHGSLAMGCFRPGHSDIDVLTIVREPASAEINRSFAQKLLLLSKSAMAVEMSVLSLSDLHPWRHPTPFQFHFSESWRERFIAALSHPVFNIGLPPVDGDLAGHVTVVRQRGVVLYGPPAGDVLPPVPRPDYLDSIRNDVLDSLDCDEGQVMTDPVYAVLNACRTLGVLADGVVRSKDEGGVWGLRCLPSALHSPITCALAKYRGQEGTEFDQSELIAFAHYAKANLA